MPGQTDAERAPAVDARLIPARDLRAPFLNAWDQLDRAASACPCPRAVALSGGIAGELRVAAATCDGQLVGVWPMVHTVATGEGILVRPGGAAQVYDGPTVRAGHPPHKIAAALWRVMSSQDDVDQVHLSALPDGCPALSLGVVGGASELLGASTRVRVTRSATDAPTSDGVALDEVTDIDERVDLIDIAIGWRSTRRLSQAATEQLLSLAASPGPVVLLALEVDGEVAAVQVGWRDGDSFTVAHTLVDPELEGCGAEGLLWLEVAAWCAESGIQVFDLSGPFPHDAPWLGILETVDVWSATLVSQASTTSAPSFRDAADARLQSVTQTHTQRTRAATRRSLLQVA